MKLQMNLVHMYCWIKVKRLCLNTHDLLINELNSMNVPAHLVRWMVAFLIDRVRIEDMLSDRGCPTEAYHRVLCQDLKTFLYTLMNYVHHIHRINTLITEHYL